MRSGFEELVSLYTAGDERLWIYDFPKNQSCWTIRDLDGKVLREYFNDGTWTVESDYLYRDAQLLAAETRYGRRHFHLDHLGTPRLITNQVGYPVAYQVYYPFGEEATSPALQPGDGAVFERGSGWQEFQSDDTPVLEPVFIRIQFAAERRRSDRRSARVYGKPALYSERLSA